MYLFDTNVIIYYIAEELSVMRVVEDIVTQEVPLYISTVTELELFSYSALTEEDEARIEAVLATLRVVPLISRIARIAGDLRRLYSRLKTADSAIAATALFTHSTLVTRNVQDFKRIDSLRVLKI
jgi:predicted nucleic acid-binding protein